MKTELLVHILAADDVVKNIKQNIDLLRYIIPEITDMIGFDHKHPHHHKNVWEHTLLALSKAPNDLEVRLSLLLHDIGKPHSYIEGDIRHYYKHAEKSAEIAHKVLSQLNFDKQYVNDICNIILLHDTPIQLEDIKENPELSRLRFQVQICDTHAHNPEYNTKRLAYLERTQNLFEKFENSTPIKE